MDLRELERWTRDALLAEAARRGITSPTLLTRRELLDAIATDAESQGEAVTRSAISRARRFLERLAFGPTRATDAEAVSAAPAVAAAPGELERDKTPVEEHDEGPVEEHQGSSASSAPPGDEPIATRTMARLLAAQGHITRARTIYDSLLPAQRATVDAPPVPEAPPSAKPRAEPALRPVVPQGARAGVPAQRSVDLVTALIVDPSTLFVCWEVTDAGMRRARAVAGEDAPLSLRVMVAASDGSGLVVTRELTRDALPEAGETFVTGLPPGALCTAAVGVSGTRFVAIAHAASAETPPTAPSLSLSLSARAHPVLGVPPDVGAAAAPLTEPERAARAAEFSRASALEVAEVAASAGGSATVGSPGGEGWPHRAWPTSYGSRL